MKKSRDHIKFEPRLLKFTCPKPGHLFAHPVLSPSKQQNRPGATENGNHRQIAHVLLADSRITDDATKSDAPEEKLTYATRTKAVRMHDERSAWAKRSRQPV